MRAAATTLMRRRRSRCQRRRRRRGFLVRSCGATGGRRARCAKRSDRGGGRRRRRRRRRRRCCGSGRERGAPLLAVAACACSRKHIARCWRHRRDERRRGRRRGRGGRSSGHLLRVYVLLVRIGSGTTIVWRQLRLDFLCQSDTHAHTRAQHEDVMQYHKNYKSQSRTNADHALEKSKRAQEHRSERDRQTEKQRNRETERQTGRQADRQTGRQTETEEALVGIRTCKCCTAHSSSLRYAARAVARWSTGRAHGGNWSKRPTATRTHIQIKHR